MMTERVIIHSDMNAFFAAVEQQANPLLRGKPVAVAGAAVRSVICTSSYEARAWGVKTGMTVGQGRRLCPELIVVPVDSAKYADTCGRLVAIYREFTPQVEVFSVDEAFLDVTGCMGRWGEPERLARAIKARVAAETGLTCSIGIAPNKLLAKLGSDLQKPDGLVRLVPGDLKARVWPLPANALCGVGPRLAEALKGIGVERIGQLAVFPVAELRRRFGLVGEEMHRWAWGIDDRPVVPEEAAAAPVSIGHSTTLERDVADRAGQERVLLQLSEMVGRRARREAWAGRTVAVTIRYPDFETFSRHRTLAAAIDDSQAIYETARGILRAVPLRAAVRLLGVRLSNLERAGTQGVLFAEDRRRRALMQAMDRINDRFGEFTLTWGGLAEEAAPHTILSPSWRPEGPRRIGPG